MSYFFTCGCCGDKLPRPTNDPWALCFRCAQAGCDFVKQREKHTHTNKRG